MTYIRRALSAELLKLRRTPSLWLVAVGPLMIVLIYGMVIVSRHDEFVVDDTWYVMTKNMFSIWAVFMLPMLCSSMTALWANFEHQANQWKYLFALPFPRTAIYGAKWILSLALLAISSLILWAGMLFQGWLMRYMVPGFGFEAAPPVIWTLKGALGIYLAAVLIVTIHAWVSLRWKNLTLALGFGVGALVTNVFAFHSETVGRFFPWSLPMRIRSVPGADPLESILLSLVGALIVAVLGGWNLTRRDVL